MFGSWVFKELQLVFRFVDFHIPFVLITTVAAQGRSRTFTLCHALLKKAILEGKTCNGRFIMRGTVNHHNQRKYTLQRQMAKRIIFE